MTTFSNSFLNILNNTNSNSINNLYQDMSKYQKNLFDSFKDEPDKFNDYSLSDLIFDFDSDFISKILEIEVNTYLDECKQNGIINKRNGYTNDINLTINNKEVSFNRPRARKETDFNSIFIPKRTRIIKDLSDNILLLYSKNNSVNDITEILKGIFDINVSTAFISHVINNIAEDIISWRTRELNSCYFAINIDCTYISIRDNKSLNSHKIPIYLAIGTTLNGHKEIVGVYLGNEDENKKIINDFCNKDIAESKTFWVTVFNDLKDRGVKKVLYIVSDGLTGIEDAIKDEWHETYYQRCVVHIVRNLKQYTNKKNSKEVIQDFKAIYTADNLELAQLNFEAFKEKYENEKTLIKHATKYMDYIFPLFNIPINIRKYIYTNNIVESANSKIKRGFYGRGALPNINSALNIIFLNLEDLEKKWQNKHVSNWDNIYNELIQVHYNDIKDYI